MSDRDFRAQDLIALVFVAACVVVILAAICDAVHDTGFDRGVRAAAKGEAVVVPLPDGTDVVVKVKKEP